MNPARVYCKADNTNKVVEFVAQGLGDKVTDYIPCLPIGIYRDDELIGGVLINDIRPQRDCWLTIYTTTPEWAKRQVMRYVFGTVFDLIQAQRCSVLVSLSNQNSFKMCRQLGFKQEGILRQYRDNGEDCYVMGMLKSECKWR